MRASIIPVVGSLEKVASWFLSSRMTTPAFAAAPVNPAFGLQGPEIGFGAVISQYANTQNSRLAGYSAQLRGRRRSAQRDDESFSGAVLEVRDSQPAEAGITSVGTTTQTSVASAPAVVRAEPDSTGEIDHHGSIYHSKTAIEWIISTRRASKFD